MTDTFDGLPWHDAELQTITIDRSRPGEQDEVRLGVVWPDGKVATVLFSDCYGLQTNMNFGIIAREQMLSAAIDDADPALVSIRETWRASGVWLDDLHCFRIETSSTASVIRIYARRFEVI